MKTVVLGTSGASVSAMGLGAMFMGTRTERALSLELLDRYLAAGGTFIDTANIYAAWVSGFRGGESEELLGDWMRQRRNRSQLFLATKVGFGYPGVERGLKAVQIEAECEKSLKRLGVDTIDLYYAHVDDRTTPQEESLAALQRLVRAGKVRFAGASNFLAWRLAEAEALAHRQGWGGYCCIQQRYTYLRPHPGASFDPQIAANDDLLDYCRTRSVTLLAYSPLLGGAYTRSDRSVPEQYRGPDSEARLARLAKIARGLGATANQIVLAWMLRSNPAVIPVMAASSVPQLTENLGALDIELTTEQLAELDGR